MRTLFSNGTCLRFFIAFLLAVVIGQSSALAEVSSNRSTAARAGQRGQAIKRGHAVFSEIAQLHRILPLPHRPLLVLPKRPVPEAKLKSKKSVARRSTSPSVGLLGLGGGNGNCNAPLASFLACTTPVIEIPPDTCGAVGPTRIVSTTNEMIRIQDRSGNILSEASMIDEFWQGGGVANPGEFLSDPRPVYDPSVDRFILTEATFDAGTESVLLAVSDTGDPTAGWTFYRIKADAAGKLLPDYPNVGFNSKWYVVSENMYQNTDGYDHVRFYVFDKADLINPSGTAKHTILDDDGSGFTMSPSTIYEANQPDMFTVETWDWTVGSLRLSKISGAVGSETLTEGIAFPLLSKPWDFPTDAEQGGGTGDTIVTGDVWRPMSLVYRNGFLWGVSCVGPLDGVAPRASAQWFELDLNGNVVQNGRIDDSTSAAPKFYYYPSIAVNQTNDVVIGMTRSSSTEFASAVFAVRTANDPPGFFAPECVLKAGEGPYSLGFRWGDFSGTMVDPDQTTFWTVQEVASTPSTNFITWWGHVSAIPPPVALFISPDRVTAGDSTTGIVTLDKPAGAGGTQVLLTTSDPTACFIPDSVLVAQGATSASFPIGTSENVNGITTVTVTATVGPDSSTASLTIAPFIAGVLLQEQFFPFDYVQTHFEVGGPVVFGAVVLSDPAPEPDGAVITLSSLLPSIASVMPSITVQAGQTVAYFPVFTTPVGVDTAIPIVGTSHGSTAFAIDTVLAPTPSSILISPNTVAGGTSTTATVTLDGVAPSTGIHVLTSSNNPAAIVDGFVDIQPGKTYGSFPIRTTPVSGNVTATITAGYNGINVTGTLKITGLGINNFVINPSSVAGGTQTTGVITLTLPAPAGGVDVLLATTPPGTVYPVTIPASVHINAGLSQAAFTILTQPTGVTTLVPIQATLGASSKTASLQVLASGVNSITITPTVMHVNTSTSAGYVFLSGTAPPGGAIVTLTIVGGGSTYPAGSIKIPQGYNRGQFTFFAPSVVPLGGYVQVTATYPAGVSKTALVKIIP